MGVEGGEGIAQITLRPIYRARLERQLAAPEFPEPAERDFDGVPIRIHSYQERVPFRRPRSPLDASVQAVPGVVIDEPEWQ